MKTKAKIGTAHLGILTMTLLILAYATSTCIAASGSSSGSSYPKVPGVPDNTKQYNKTNITPVAEMEQVMAGEPALFRYRNMTMLMNCTRNCTVIFTADPEVTPRILWLSIEPNRTMTLTINMYRSPLQGEQVMERTLNFYMGIEPNAEVQLRAQIRLHVNQTQLEQELNREVNVSRLTWMYWNRTRAQWEPVESYMDQNGYLICNTNHFSLWTVAEIADITTSTADTSEGGFPAEYIYIGIAAIAMIAIAVGAFAYKKRK